MKTQTKTVREEDKEYAACNTPGCPCGADLELWQDGIRKDARCIDCADKLKWARYI